MKLQVLAQYAGQSFRLLAVAGGVLSNVSPAELAGMDQQQAEARCGPLELLGLQILSNCLRPSSRQTVTNLRDRSATCTSRRCFHVFFRSAQACLLVTADSMHGLFCCVPFPLPLGYGACGTQRRQADDCHVALHLFMQSVSEVCRGAIRTMMLTGDSHQTAISVSRGVGMLPSSSQLVIIQARSELQSTPHSPSRSLMLPAYPVVSTFSGSGKPDGQEAGSAQASGSRFAGSMGARNPSFTKMCGTTTADSAASLDPVSPSGAAQEQPLLQKSGQQGSSLQPSCQQGLSQQSTAQQQLLHQQSYQAELSENSSSVSPLKVDMTQPVASQQDTDQVGHRLQSSSCEALVFMLQSEDDEKEIDAQRAITSMAQVDCPCTQCLLRHCLASHIFLVHLCCSARVCCRRHACLTTLLPCIAAPHSTSVMSCNILLPHVT